MPDEHEHELRHEHGDGKVEPLVLRAVPPFWVQKGGYLHVEVINEGPETGRDVVVSVEYAGGSYGDPPENGRQNLKIPTGLKKGDKVVKKFTLPNEDSWNPHLLFDITVDTGGDSEKNETVIVRKEER